MADSSKAILGDRDTREPLKEGWLQAVVDGADSRGGGGWVGRAEQLTVCLVRQFAWATVLPYSREH